MIEIIGKKVLMIIEICLITEKSFLKVIIIIVKITIKIIDTTSVYIVLLS